MFSFKPRRALLPTVSWGASLSPLKKRASTSVRVRAPKAAGGATLLTIKSTTRAGKRGVRTSARIQPRAWSFAPVLLAAVLAACGQVDASKSTTAQASAAPAASRAAAPAASGAQGADGIPPLTPEEKAVVKRAQERWDALMAENFEHAWTYLEPDERKKIGQKNYKDQFGSAGRWLEAKVLNAKCITGRCAAYVRLSTEIFAQGFPQGKANATTHFDEEWVLQDGQWWYRGLRQQKLQEEEGDLPSAALPRPSQPPQPAASGIGAWGGSARR